MMSVGLLGGTFDPPHNGHLTIAETVLEALQLDQIRFVPTNIPPHKQQPVAAPRQRVEMLELLTQGNGRLTVDQTELARTGASYTIDTVRILQKAEPDVRFYFIIGADMIDTLPHWKEIDELVQLVSFVGVRRPSYNGVTNYPVKMVTVPELSVSSTQIRARLYKGHDVNGLLPGSVLTYLKEHGLYGI